MYYAQNDLFPNDFQNGIGNVFGILGKPATSRSDGGNESFPLPLSFFVSATTEHGECNSAILLITMIF